MQRAIELAHESVRIGMGGPFGAVIVRQGVVIGEGANRVLGTNDPTAHAEVTAIRDACAKAQDFSLVGAEIYTSCEPCPMCLAAIYWARIDKIWFSSTRADAAAIGFDDELIYREIPLPLSQRRIPSEHIFTTAAGQLFQGWRDKADKIPY